MRKNSLGLQGATCLAAILLKNVSIESLFLDDNDIGANGGECFGIALTQNNTLKHLKVSENELRTEGAIFIIKNSHKLESLDLSKNYITSQAGPALERLVLSSKRLKKLVLEYNELLPSGAEFIARGLRNNSILNCLNLKGNILGDEGVFHLINALQHNETIRELNIALNEIGPVGASAMANMLPNSNIQSLNIGKNYLGDEAVIVFADILCGQDTICKLKSINLASCRVADRGVEYFFASIVGNKSLNSVNLNDNFISEKLEPILLECLDANFYLSKVRLIGNRLSHACLNRVKKICERNRREQENAEPNRLKNEAYRLQYENRKLALAQDQLQKQITEVDKVKEMREDIMSQIEVIRENEKAKRELERQKIQSEMNMMQEKENNLAHLQMELDTTKIKYKRITEDMELEYLEKVKRKQEIEADIQNIEHENRDLEVRNIQVDVPDMIKELEFKIEMTRKETATIEEETRLVREEMSRIELEIATLREQRNIHSEPEKDTSNKDISKKPVVKEQKKLISRRSVVRG